jgi:5-methylcytosine-specific restriction protein B
MDFTNEAAFQESLKQFALYAQTPDYRRDERDYKEHLVGTLGAALTDEALAAADFPEGLREAVRICSGAIDNLSHWTATDSFKKYLGVVQAERAREILHLLFDEQQNLAVRIDSFLRELRGDYEKHSLPVKTSWLVSILLSARFPEEYTFYRPTIIKDAWKRWGVTQPPPTGTSGEKYAAYIDFLKSIREQLSAALDHPADLIDVHSFLWVSYSPPEGDSPTSWREKLAKWLLKNPPTIPEEMRSLREEFVRRFPKEKLGELTLEQYALGHEGSRDSFCYWLEFKTKKLGHMGGDARKFGVWWDKTEGRWRWNRIYDSAEEALARIKGGLSALVEATEQGRFDELDRIGGEQLGPSRYGLRCKPLSIYFPEHILPVWQPEHIAHFLKLFGAEPRGEVLARNRQLLELLRGLPEFEGLDNLQATFFLYDAFPPSDGVDSAASAALIKPKSPANIPRELEELMDIAARTRNVLLYGPPGVGKTYWVRRFTESFLTPQLAASPTAPEQRIALLQELKWYEAIALTMFLEEGGGLFKVPAIKGSALIQEYALLKVAKRLNERLWGELQTHTAPGSPTVNTSTRHEPFLFDKSEGSEWSLTKEGREYVEENLGDVLAQLRNPQTSKLKVEDFSEFVTFHQSFAYEEFVEGLKPVADEDTGGISYEVVPGVFKRICERARAAWEANRENPPKYLLVVDEINRANIAKVLGELITLIEDDKRLGRENQLTATLPYSGERFGVPPNLYILGTMNTADRSIALLDLALRRRFTFVEMEPEPSAIEPGRVAGIDLRALLSGLNERVAALLDRDHRIGHSYLMNLTDEPSLRFAWYARVVPLLQEYFYNDGERLLAVLGPRFVRRTRVSRATVAALGELYDAEQPPHEVARLEGAEFLEALRELAGGIRAAGAEAEENLTPEEAGTED